MNKPRRFLSILPAMLLWAMLASFFWSWIFGFITDTTPDRKITIFADMQTCRETELAVTLEQDLPEGIRMVRVRRFAHAMMNSTSLRAADLYIVPVCDLETYRDWFAPLPESLRDGFTLSAADGTPLGLPLYDSSAGLSIGEAFLGYDHPEHPGEAYVLVFGAAGPHEPRQLLPVVRTLLNQTESVKE